MACVHPHTESREPLHIVLSFIKYLSPSNLTPINPNFRQAPFSLLKKKKRKEKGRIPKEMKFVVFLGQLFFDWTLKK